jgi:hypothetical protein
METILDFTLLSRVLLPSIFPETGSYVEHIVNSSIKKKVELTVSEIEKYKIQEVPGGLVWDKAFDKEVISITFSERETEHLKDRLQKAEDEKRLHYGLINLFVILCNPAIPEDLKPQ